VIVSRRTSGGSAIAAAERMLGTHYWDPAELRREEGR
jgi:hypothetical protein